MIFQNLNYDTIVAEQQALNIEIFAHSFFAAKTKRYLLIRKYYLRNRKNYTEKTKDMVHYIYKYYYEIKRVLNQSIYKPFNKRFAREVQVNDVLFVLKKVIFQIGT